MVTRSILRPVLRPLPLLLMDDDAGFTPRSLFASGEQGIWLDPSDFSSMFQDAAGTTPVTAVGQSVGKILDKSGRGNHASQSTAASRPTVEARVNLFTRTEELDHADWTKYGVTVTANAGVGYDGSINLDKVMEVSAASTPRIAQTRPTIIGQTYIAYFDAKAAERTQIRIVAEGSSLRSAYYNLSTGAVISQGLSASAYMSALGNGLYRCWLVYTATAAVSDLYVCTAEAGSVVTSGDPSKGVFLGRADFRLASDAAYPYQRVNTATDYVDVGAPRYLSFDGTDDGMATPSIDFTGTDKMTVWAGVRKLSDAATGIVCELSAVATSNSGTFYISAPEAAGVNKFTLLSRGTVSSSAAVLSATYNAPVTAIVSGIGGISGDSAIIRVNGVQAASSVDDQGTGNYGNYPLYIGRRAGTSLPFNGRIYQLIIRGAESNAGQIAAAEAWMNSKTRAY